MFYPTLSMAIDLATSQEYGFIPVSYEIKNTSLTPTETLYKLKTSGGPCYLFESAETTSKSARYTFLGFKPSLEFNYSNGKGSLKRGSKTELVLDNPNKIIRNILSEYKSPQLTRLPPFTGGLVGYFSFEYIQYSAPELNLTSPDYVGFEDVNLMLFDNLIVFDHLTEKIHFIINVKREEIVTGYEKAKKELINLEKTILASSTPPVKKGYLTSPFRELYDKEEFCLMVEKAQTAIQQGDFKQIVLANSFDANFVGSLLGTYEILRTINPSPYMFYLENNDLEVVGASPETLVKLRNGSVSTFPLAGTRQRGKSLAEDIKLERELLADAKELAEHEMLVQLGCEDLEKICQPGTVIIEKEMSVEKFSHVMHLGSTIKGKLKDNCDALHALEATLPAGTLCGIPKIQACQFINDLESQKRGIYGGAIGYLGFNGNLDTCIAIRLAYQKDGKVYVRTGAGIVSDSDPTKEYKECHHKAKALLKALMVDRKLTGGVGS